MFFRYIQPCSPILAKAVPAGDDWLHEPRLDGYRLQVAKHGRMMRLCRGDDWNKAPRWDWRKVKTVAWCEANRDRWRLFERA